MYVSMYQGLTGGHERGRGPAEEITSRGPASARELGTRVVRKPSTLDPVLAQLVPLSRLGITGQG